MEAWDISKSVSQYCIDLWGEGYFAINQQGNIVARPERNGAEIDLYEIVRTVSQRGIPVPVLLRFDGIIRDRIKRMNESFVRAREEAGYGGNYLGVFPVKVNQQRHVIDTIRMAGRDYGLGLEVGSKPELCAVLAVHDTPGGLILCNGYKDDEYIELALMAGKLGRRPIIIVEQLYELEQTLRLAERLGVQAEIGIRMKPVSKGAGRWETSGGDRAKFGLTTPEIVSAIEKLKQHGKQDCLKLLHYHIGSQITSISAIKKVLREATRMYTEIAKLCPGLCFFDVGGGLAVDYDGSKTNFQSSMNYTVEEYARDVVYSIHHACEEAGIQAPTIVTESGRAMIAHHAVLVFQVIDTAPAHDAVAELESPPSDHELLSELQELYSKLSVKNCVESVHDAVSLREEILERFIQGEISLLERAYADKSFWHLIAKVRKVSTELKFVPEDIEKLDEQLKDTYFCNFSVFQSLPDSWAIDQLFPIAPIHRLREQPTRRAILADMTCDSDGQIDHLIDLKDVKSYVTLHPLKYGESYYLGAFLVGAYQEILGDLHNLFGDTNAVHVDLDSEGKVKLTHVVEGDTVREALGYVQYEPQDLTERLRMSIEEALKEGKISNEEGAKIQKRYKEALEGYTYLYVEGN
ncbi:MAG: biosynthetic arginine decarboxylase [Proteobacteria bacterium]|nr:MAG: biosynthetic arginine decarboxylase [Pseudomonadota bacterium]